MKPFLLAALAALPLSTPALAGSTSTQSLTLDCHALGTVESVSEEGYHPGEPPKYRYPGYPAAGGFKGIVKVSALSPGCAPLKAKYDLNVEGSTFPAYFSVKKPESMEQAKEIAQETLGQTLPLKLQQDFSYEKDGYLPLFPIVHEEKLQFLTNAPELGADGSFELKPNLKWVYGIKELENFSDIEKLSLAEKAAVLMGKGNFGDFSSLFLNLKPHAPGMKKAYGELILKALHELKAGHQYQALLFTTGGSGTLYGAPLAEAFNRLSHQALFSDQEIEHAAFDIPTLLIAGYPGESKTCFNVTEQSLLSVLNELSSKLPILTAKEKYIWERPLSALSGKMLYGFCQQGQSPAVKELASSLLPHL